MKLTRLQLSIVHLAQLHIHMPNKHSYATEAYQGTSLPRAALPALDRMGEPDFRLEKSDCVECARLKPPLPLFLDCSDDFRVSNADRSLSDLYSAGTSVSSEVPGVKPAQRQQMHCWQKFPSQGQLLNAAV